MVAEVLVRVSGSGIGFRSFSAVEMAILQRMCGFLTDDAARLGTGHGVKVSGFESLTGFAQMFLIKYRLAGRTTAECVAKSTSALGSMTCHARLRVDGVL